MNFPPRSCCAYVLALVLALPAVAGTQCQSILDPNNGGEPLTTCNDMHVKLWFTFTADATATGTQFSSLSSSVFGSQAGLDPLTRALALFQGYDGRQFGTTLFSQFAGLAHGPDVPMDGFSTLDIVSGSLVHFQIDNPNPFPVAIDLRVSSNFTTDLIDPMSAGAGIDVDLALVMYRQGATEPFYTASGTFSQTSAGVQTTGLYDGADIVVGNTRAGLDTTSPEILMIEPNSSELIAAARRARAKLRAVGPDASVIYDAGTTHTISLFTTAPGVTITAVPEPTTLALSWAAATSLNLLIVRWRRRHENFPSPCSVDRSGGRDMA